MRQNQRGGLRQQYWDGQEDQLSAFSLLVNITATWNNIYIGAALGQLRQEGFPVHDEGVAFHL